MKPKSSRLFEVLSGLGLSVFVLWSYYLNHFIFKDPSSFNGPSVFSWLENLEFKLYDARSKLRTSIDAGSKEIAIVTIDDDSLARLGRWPWPRTRMAQMIDMLAAAKPKVIGVDVVYSEPEEAEGAQEIQALEAKYKELLRSRRIAQRGNNFASEFDAALNRLNFDQALAESFQKAGNVVLPMMFAGGGLRGAKPEPMPSAIANLALKANPGGTGMDRMVWDGIKPIVPIPLLAQAVQGVGHVNVYPDFDGVVRREYPIIRYNGAFYPSFALELVIRYLGSDPKDVTVTPGRSVQLGASAIPLDDNQSMLVSFNGPYQTFHYYSFYDVLNGKVAMDVFKDKIVLVGHSAAAISTLYATPVGHSLPGTEFIANVIENMMHSKFLTRPDWAMKAELGSIAVAALFVVLILPLLSAFSGAFTTILFLAVLGAAGVYYFIHGLWLKIAYAGALLAAGYVIITTRRFLAVEKGKERVEASAIETNKMLGLSFQGQGMLDMAFEKFRLCPVDGQLKDLLYNLGLDFERKRQYNKAAAVYEHISAADSKYKDIADKIKVLKEAAAGAVFGGVGGKKEGTLMMTQGASKPTLGRYQVEKEIGRGAMGIVYLGNDPKINRKVAIKTLVMEDGMEPALVKETKERFFREAESAGTLNHPNIVRIFDAGEEHDVAYIAMELLDGHDFTEYISKDHLLPSLVAMEYVAKVADALDYAHAQGIIHRDVKPANIMLLKDNSIRVMDFGIARIIASSKTATGTVVGTPAYMSPEQVSGKKVDGRSDLFSLGVVLFELLTGQKPFKVTEAGLGALLFQIANDPEPDPLTLNRKLPPCVAQIIHQALKKDVTQRYQKGSEMAAALRNCAKMTREGVSSVPAETAPAQASEPVPVKVEATEKTVSLKPTLPPVASAPPTPSVGPTLDLPGSIPQPRMEPVQPPPPAPEPAPAVSAPLPDVSTRSAEEIAATITEFITNDNAPSAPAGPPPNAAEQSTLNLNASPAPAPQQNAEIPTQSSAEPPLSSDPTLKLSKPGP